MRQMSRFATGLAWLLLVCSLAFSLYLFPLPSTSVDRALSALPSGAGTDVREYVESSVWLAWISNLTLFVSGTGASGLWVTSARSTPRKWLALVLAIVFVALSGLIVVVQANGAEPWVQQKAAFLRQLLAAGIWTYLLAELHRLISSLVSLAAAAAMLITLIKSNVARPAD